MERFLNGEDIKFITPAQEETCRTGICPKCGMQLHTHEVVEDIHFTACTSCHDMWLFK